MLADPVVGLGTRIHKKKGYEVLMSDRHAQRLTKGPDVQGKQRSVASVRLRHDHTSDTGDEEVGQEMARRDCGRAVGRRTATRFA